MTDSDEDRKRIQEEIDHFETSIPSLENIVFDENETLSFYERAKKEGFYDAFMEGPQAIEKYMREKFD